MSDHVLVLSAVLVLAAGAAHAQQQQTPQPQAAQPQSPQAQAQAMGTTPPLVVRLEFGAELPGSDDLIAAATALAEPDYAARIDASPEPDGLVTGTLVSADAAAFSEWREADMEGYFEPIGGPDGVAMDVTVFRPEELRLSDPESVLGGLEGLSIHYANTGNEAAGDADIDAVTVICTGGDARCTPSN